MGLAVTAIDVNADALVELAANRGQMPHDRTGPIKAVREDLEEPPLPVLEGGHFGAVLVFNYLHRPLFPWIASLVAPGGLVLYETFTVAQKALGWGPKRDAFLLRAGELPTLLPDFVAEFYAEGPSQDARAPNTARLLARRPV
jgi:tellurite methyltransferase